MSNADRSQWQFPKNEAGHAIGWRADGKGMQNHKLGAGSVLDAPDDDDLTIESDQLALRKNVKAALASETDRATGVEAALDGRVGAAESGVAAADAKADAADTKAQTALDTALAGIKPDSPAVRVLTTANVAIASALENGDTLDGVALVTGDRVALVGQTAPAENGVYVVAASGAAARAADFDTSDEILRSRFTVSAGSHAGEAWAVQNTSAITVGATAIAIVMTAPSNPMNAEVIAARGGRASLNDRFAGFDTVLGDVTEVVSSLNLYNPVAKQSGKYINGSGNIASAPVWACSDYIPVIAGDAYTISWTGTKRVGVSFFTGKITTGIGGSYSASSSNPLTLTAPVGAAYMVVNVQSDTIPEPSNIMINAGAAALPYEAYYVRSVIKADAVYPSEADRASAKLVLNGAGSAASYVESTRGGFRLRHSFIPFPGVTIAAAPCRFNLASTYLDGVLMRTATDDIAPDHIESTTLGANHGYQMGSCTATGHGKTAADEGSRWTSSGVAVVLVKIVDANTLLMARETANTAPATGTYTHVSGATATGNITVSAVTGIQWYPPHMDYSILVLVDGVEVTEQAGAWPYSQSVQFVETCLMLRRTDIIDWWIANGGASGGDPEGDPDMLSTTTYHFDRDGQLSIAQQRLVLRSMPITDLMGLQVQRAGAPDQYYVPGALPITYDSETLDYSMGVASGRTLSAAGQPSIIFDETNLQASGEFGQRILSLWSDKVLAVGFLPVGDAALDVRRDRVSNTAIELRGNSGKQYFRFLDKGAHTAAAGDSYSAIGYRHVAPRIADRTSLYTVRTEGAAYVFADWHDKAGMDRLPIPADLTGRAFEVVEARNVTVKSGILAGSLPVMVSANGASAALILKVI